ncbi:Small ribosomal subunit protein [Trichinella spiralis]|uniref:Small ribosomal subunit protein n=1 Tax=Trichinella spiralis TaxID=6334 RepID=A0ABR3KS71_TRISP
MSSMYAEVPFLISGSRESTQFSTAFITNADSPHLLRCIQYFISRRCSFMVLKKHSTFSAGDCGFVSNADSPHLLRCIQYFISRRCSFMVLKKHSTFSAGDCGFGIQRGLAGSSPLYLVLHFSAMFLHGTQEAQYLLRCTSFLGDVPSWYSRSIVPSPLVTVVSVSNANSPDFLRCIQYFISRRCSFMVLKKHSTFSAGDCGFGIQRGLAGSSPLSIVPSPLVIVVLYPTRTRRIFSVVLSTSFLGDVPSLYYKKHSTLSAADRAFWYYQQHSILSAGDCGFASNVDSPLSPCSRLLSRPEVDYCWFAFLANFCSNISNLSNTLTAHHRQDIFRNNQSQVLISCRNGLFIPFEQGDHGSGRIGRRAAKIP